MALSDQSLPGTIAPGAGPLGVAGYRLRPRLITAGDATWGQGRILAWADDVDRTMQKDESDDILSKVVTMSAATTAKQAVDFYFDPSCPWAWRTALWIQEVAKVRPIDVTWKFLSLAKINEGHDYASESHAASHATFPLLARARERVGNEAVRRLYVALGQARHERKESLGDAAVIERALQRGRPGSRLAHGGCCRAGHGRAHSCRASGGA